MSINKEFAIKKSSLNSGQNVDFKGGWINEFGSVLIIDEDKNQQIKGTYKTAKGAPPSHESFSLIGFASGDLVSFTVNFGKYGSLTGWVGQHTEENGIEVIKTSWLLAKNIEEVDEDANLWGAILTGANTFKRIIK